MSTALEVIPTKSLSELISKHSPLQKNFLILKALGSDDREARRLASVAESTYNTWKGEDAFKNTLVAIYDGHFHTEAIELFLDTNLPTVLGELLLICTSGSDGERPHKDKERAIEFYLKELCGVSKHVEKSMSIAQILLKVQEDKGVPKESN
jgi:hypothetical protein